MEEAFVHVIETVGGFFLGVGLEYLSITGYNFIDQTHESNFKLLIVVCVNLLVLFFIVQRLNLRMKDSTFAVIGLFASQAFVFDYTVKRFYDPATLLKIS